MKKLAWLLLLAVTVTAAVYLFRHLIRWEWHRAMFAGIAMLAGEIALATAVIVRTIRRALAERGNTGVDERVLARLRESRPPSGRVFAWLKPEADHTNVFVSILLAGGVVVSAAAWAIDKVAKTTSTGGMENRLAARLATLQPPPDGFVAADDTLLAAGRPVDDDTLELLLGPSPRGGR